MEIEIVNIREIRLRNVFTNGAKKVHFGDRSDRHALGIKCI